MRTFIKKQLIDLLDSIKQLQNSLPMMFNKNQVIQMLANCQDAAVAIGETLERDSADHKPIICLLEEYCEEVFNLSEIENRVIGEDEVYKLDRFIDKVRTLLEDISAPYHVIFMPYKASMWDSLESIWRVCKEDKRCKCYVIPLPYYEFDSKNDRWLYSYDGDQLPREVSITHYQNYSLEQNRPDLVYVHNPYDDCNLVTRIDPCYYSQELKKYAGKLVYVPYYVTSGFIAHDHLLLSIYQHMDFMVVQSEYAKSFCQGMFYYDKILPFGSPKLDRVIKLCQEGNNPPEQWKTEIEDKTVLMLNTSIGCFLLDGSDYLKKIRSLCKYIVGQNQVAIIWRPHPLLEATIKSMRPELLAEYNDLKEFFLYNKIGVLDNTLDISKTVAISDAYIGEEGSSVINLFGAAGKPLFILNNYITDSFTMEEKRRVHFTDMIIEGDKLWFVTNRYNALFSMDTSKLQIQYEGRAEFQPKWCSAYPFFTLSGNGIYFSPDLSVRPAVYEITTGSFGLIGSGDMKESARRGMCFSYKESIFYLPIIDNYIAEFNTETKEWIYHSQCIEELSRGVDTSIVINQGMTFRCSVCGEEVWITATYTNRILRFNMNDGTYAICQVGNKESGYSGIIAEERYLWLAEVENGNIIRWDRRSGRIKTFCMPKGFSSWTGAKNRKSPHLSLINIGKWVVTIPRFSNSMVKIDKITGDVSLFIEEFWKIPNKKANGYNTKFYVSSEFGAKLSESSIIVQRNWDDATAIVNVESGTFNMFYPTLSNENFYELTEGEDGFEKIDEKSGFFRRESKLFSFEGFLDDLIHERLNGVRERQRKELSTLAANLDGTCGIKVHEYMMDVIEMH